LRLLSIGRHNRRTIARHARPLRTDPSLRLVMSAAIRNLAQTRAWLYPARTTFMLAPFGARQ